VQTEQATGAMPSHYAHSLIHTAEAPHKPATPAPHPPSRTTPPSPVAPPQIAPAATPYKNRQLRGMAFFSTFFSFSFLRDAEEWRLAFTQRRMK